MSIDRRTVVTGTTSLALSAATAAHAMPISAPVRQSLVQLASIDPNTQILLNNSAFIVQKRVLASTYTWLQPFAADLPVDAIIYNALSPLVGQQPPYDPYQIESLAAAVSSLLDRCLTYRQNLYALDERATMTALQYDLFNKQAGPLQQIELATQLEQKWNNEKTGEANAANIFSADDKETANVSRGFAALAKMKTTSAGYLASGEQTRQNNVNAKWTANIAYQKALQARHNTPGNALNYVERYNRITGYLQQDIVVAFQKLQCLANACNALFSLSLPLPPLQETGYLDTLVTYTRTLINKVEIATVKEVSFNHVVYLRQPKSTTSTGPAPAAGRIPSDLWTSTLKGNRLFTFNLEDAEFPGSPAITRLRMTSIGLSMAISVPSGSSGDQTFTYKSTSAVIFPPEAPDLFSAGGVLKRPPIIIEGVGLTGPGGPPMLNSSSIRNIDPRGQWQIQVSANFFQPNPSSAEAPTVELQDIKLHMNLTALLSADPNDWQNFAM
jgi:hypothetical protein